MNLGTFAIIMDPENCKSEFTSLEPMRPRRESVKLNVADCKFFFFWCLWCFNVNIYHCVYTSNRQENHYLLSIWQKLSLINKCFNQYYYYFIILLLLFSSLLFIIVNYYLLLLNYY